MTAAERSKKSYHKRKVENEEHYKLYLEGKKVQSKQRRDRFKSTATEEEIALKREKNQRVARHRQKKKELGIPLAEQVNGSQKTKRPFTRKEQEKIDKKREKDRERKKLQRQGWSRQQRKAESLKPVERKRRRKSEAEKVQVIDERTHEVKEDVVEHESGTDTRRNKLSRRQALYNLYQRRKLQGMKRSETC